MCGMSNGMDSQINEMICDIWEKWHGDGGVVDVSDEMNESMGGEIGEGFRLGNGMGERMGMDG